MTSDMSSDEYSIDDITCYSYVKLHIRTCLTDIFKLI